MEAPGLFQQLRARRAASMVPGAALHRISHMFEFAGPLVGFEPAELSFQKRNSGKKLMFIERNDKLIVANAPA